MNLRVERNGQHTLSVERFEEIPATALVYLDDLKTGHTQELTSTSTYSFTADRTDNASRFLLRFDAPLEIAAKNATCTQSTGEVSVYQAGNANWNVTLKDANGTAVATATTQNGSTSVFDNLAAGNYELVFELPGGKTVTEQVAIAAVTPVSATATAPANDIFVGDAVQFTSNVAGATAYLWTFSNGTTSVDANPIVSFNAPGSYTATLLASNADCSAESQISFEVLNKTTSRTDALAESGIKVFADAQNQIVVVFEKTLAGNANIQVMDMAGRTMLRQTSTATGKVTLNGGQLAAGIYNVRVVSKGVETTQKVVIR
jgi:PKD repeat protein